MSKVLSVWPELHLISDLTLRNDVIRVWEYALSTSGTEPDDLHEIPFTRSISNCTIPFIVHKRLVVHIAYDTAKHFVEFLKGAIQINLDHVVAGSMLIDLGKVLERSPQYQGKHHSLIGVEVSEKFHLHENIKHIIEAHTKEYEGALNSPEAIIVRNADLMSYAIIKRQIENSESP